MFLFVYAIGYTYKDSLEFSILETQIQVIKLPAHFFILQWRKFVSVELLMTCWKEKGSSNFCAVFITKRWLQTTGSKPSTVLYNTWATRKPIMRMGLKYILREIAALHTRHILSHRCNFSSFSSKKDFIFFGFCTSSSLLGGWETRTQRRLGGTTTKAKASHMHRLNYICAALGNYRLHHSQLKKNVACHSGIQYKIPLYSLHWFPYASWPRKN